MLQRIDPAIPLPPRAAPSRARASSRCSRFSLRRLGVHLFRAGRRSADTPTCARSRSGSRSLFALWLILGALFSDGEPIPVPDSYLWAIARRWSGWSAASWFWSLHPAYTRAEIGTEIGWGLGDGHHFLRRGALRRRVSRDRHHGRRRVPALLSVARDPRGAAGAGVDPERTLVRPHGGVGAFSTYLVLLVPLLPLLLAPRPIGYGTGPVTVAVAVAIFVLLLIVAARADREPHDLARARHRIRRRGDAGGMAMARRGSRARRCAGPRSCSRCCVLVAVLFVDAAVQRATSDHRPDTSVAQAIADDPRFVALATHVRAHPRAAVDRLRLRQVDPAHRVAGRAAAIRCSRTRTTCSSASGCRPARSASRRWSRCSLALAWRYGAFLRSADGTLAAIGLVGLVMLAMFVVKNLTDDFMVRPTSKEFWALNALADRLRHPPRARGAAGLFASPSVALAAGRRLTSALQRATARPQPARRCAFVVASRTGSGMHRRARRRRVLAGSTPSGARAPRRRRRRGRSRTT